MLSTVDRRRPLLALGLLASVASALAFAQPDEPALVRLTVEILTVEVTATGAPEDLPISGWLIVESEQAPPRRLALGEARTMELQVPDRKPTRLSVESPAYWVHEEVVLPNGEAVEVSLALRPAGWLEGTLQVPADHTLPASLDARFESPPKTAPKTAPAIGPSTVACPVDSEGSWRCQVPGGVLDVRFRVPGYVSIHQWGVEVAARSTVEMDRLILEPGASVVGWVVTEDDSPLGWKARATLIPATATPAASGSLGLSRRSESTPVLPRGFFHLRGVAPGRYLLRIEREGFAPAETGVTLLEGKETRLSRPLMLRRPGVLEVTVDPPRDPADAPWTVKLVEIDQGGEPRAGKVTGEGTFEWEGLGSGEYWVLVESGPAGDPQRWRTERIAFEPGMPAVPIRVDWLEVHGTVRLGEDPLESVLLFGGRHGERRLKIETDDEGFYLGHLPEPGTWPLSVYSKETGWRTVEPVDVEPLPGSRRARVDVTVPSTLLEGEVVDTEGRPVEDALVTAFHMTRLQEQDRARSDEEGRFELVGLSTGPVKIWAMGAAPEELSRALLVHVGEEETPESIRLEIERLTRVEGWVEAAGRPVAGAEIFPWIQAAGLGFAFERPRILTGVDGRFDFLIPPDTVDLDLLVLPPGFAARFHSVELPLRGEVSVAVDDVAGTVVLDLASFESSEGSDSSLRPAATLMWEGARAAVPYLNRWARFHGTRADADRVILPSMSPGQYTLCVPRGTAQDQLAGESKGEDCASGFLPPHGELRLGTVP